MLKKVWTFYYLSVKRLVPQNIKNQIICFLFNFPSVVSVATAIKAPFCFQYLIYFAFHVIYFAVV